MLLFSTSNFSLGVGKKKKKSALVFKSADLNMEFDALFIVCLLCDQLPGGWTLLVARQSEMNAHLMAVVSVYTNIVHDDCLTRSVHDLCSSVVLFFYCNCYSVITSHLVNSWNCLLPQKCFKFKFYITVLMFYKWCTSCLCIICSTLVIKAQSLNFILSHYYMNFSLGEISLWSLVNHFQQFMSGWTKWLLIVIVHSVAYIWAAFIQIWNICCVYWENCMQIHP